MTRVTIRLAVAVAAAGVLVVALAGAGHAIPSSGVASIVDADGKALSGGSSKTEFTFKLPKGAACQRDSQDGGYRVASFLVPPSYDPGELTYNSNTPNGEGNWSLFDVFTDPYVVGLTGVATEKGGPGPIVNTPLFSFAVWLPRLDLLPSGSYHVGLACTHYFETKRYWSTTIDIDVDPGKPEADQISWRVTGPVAAAGDSGSSAAPGVLVALGAAALIVVLVVRKRRAGPAVAAAALVLVVLVAAPRPAKAAVAASAATIVRPANAAVDRLTPLLEGSRSTAFSLQLPSGSSCSGDSANDGFRVQGFHIPRGDSLDGLRFASSGPTPGGFGAALRQPLYTESGDPFVDAQTAPASPAPGPGPVVNLPAFSFALYSAEQLPAGDYLIGVACTKGAGDAQVVEKVWTAPLQIGTDRNWRVIAATTPGIVASSGDTTATNDASASSSDAGSRSPDAAGSAESVAAAVVDAAAPEPGPSSGFPLMTLQQVGDAGGSLNVPILVVALLALARMAFLLVRRPAARTHILNQEIQ